MIEKNERFEMRMDQKTIEYLDDWRNQQREVPSRAEAIRRLIEKESTSSRDIKFNAGEKLIIHMLCDIYKSLKIKSELDPKFIESALLGGHYWALEWEYPSIYHSHQDKKQTVSEVVDILDMWDFMESAYKKLSTKEKERIKKEGGRFSNHVTFLGFDGNNESEHLNIALFLIKEMERFTSFKGRDLNSHCRILQTYREMFRVFEPIRATLVGRELSASEIITILNGYRPSPV